MKDEERIALDIVSYLTQKPSAKDTFEGIAEWWLLKQEINKAVDIVDQALALLESKGFVSVKHYRGQEKYYQLNKEKLQEAKKFLSEKKTHK